MANFGMVGVDWQERINWDRMRKYRLNRARQAMKEFGLVSLLCMYEENIRHITSTLTPNWNKLKPGLRYCLLIEDQEPILFEQGDIGFHIQRHCPWIPKENVRYSYAWIRELTTISSTDKRVPQIRDFAMLTEQMRRMQ